MPQQRNGPAVEGEAGAQFPRELGHSTAQQTDAQLTPVDVFAPWSGPEERSLRLRLHKAQTVATAIAAREDNGDARSLYYHAGQVASAWVFRRVVDRAQLERVLWGVNQLFLAADHFRQAETAYDR